MHAGAPTGTGQGVQGQVAAGFLQVRAEGFRCCRTVLSLRQETGGRLQGHQSVSFVLHAAPGAWGMGLQAWRVPLGGTCRSGIQDG